MATRQNRTWHSGPPPHVGWWNASNHRGLTAWRWWNGSAWSLACFPDEEPRALIFRTSRFLAANAQIEWSDYWPDNARVPRIAP